MSATGRTASIIRAALGLHEAGYWLTVCCSPNHPPGECTIPRRIPCHSPGKAPIHRRWQSVRLSADDIERLLVERPTSNIGIRWGECSGLVDVEADNDAAERAFCDLFGSKPETPAYVSRRGTHRVFRYADGLPKAVVKLREIEFRMGGDRRGAQSVVPPSIHHTGCRYRWVKGRGLGDVE